MSGIVAHFRGGIQNAQENALKMHKIIGIYCACLTKIYARIRSSKPIISDLVTFQGKKFRFLAKKCEKQTALVSVNG